MREDVTEDARWRNLKKRAGPVRKKAGPNPLPNPANFGQGLSAASMCCLHVRRPMNDCSITIDTLRINVFRDISFPPRFLEKERIFYLSPTSHKQFLLEGDLHNYVCLFGTESLDFSRVHGQAEVRITGTNFFQTYLHCVRPCFCAVQCFLNGSSH